MHIFATEFNDFTTMKRVFFLLVFSLGYLHAQQGLHVGVTGGPQSTWLFNEHDSNEGPNLDYQPRWGSNFGLRLGYHFTDFVGIESGLLYSTRGQKYKGELDYGLYGTPNAKADLTALTRLNYLQIPFLFSTGSDPSSTSAFKFYTGPQLMFLMGTKEELNIKNRVTNVEWKGTGTATSYELVTQIPNLPAVTDKGKYSDSKYTKFQLAWVLGFGTSFKIAENMFLDLTFRFDYAFGDAENKEITIIEQNGTAITTNQPKVWDKLESKFKETSNPNAPKRPQTMNVAGGVNFGFTYVLGSN